MSLSGDHLDALGVILARVPPETTDAPSRRASHEASNSLEDRVARIERILGLVPVPDCTMCHGTGEVNWGGSNKKNTGPCWCTTRPWQRRQW